MMSHASSHPVRRAYRLALLLCLLAGTLSACVSGGRQSLRDGVLRQGIGQTAVLSEWGLPARTMAVVSEDQIRTRWGSAPTGALFRERQPLDLWLYEKQGVELLFDGGDLVGWKTDRTSEQLRALRQAQAVDNPYPAGGGQQALLQGLLRVDIGQKAFRTQWGQPERSVPIASAADLEARWGAGIRGSVLEGRRPLEIWVYERYGVELLFDDGNLTDWKTQKTVEELRKIPTQR
jgi:hypothetical protein